MNKRASKEKRRRIISKWRQSGISQKQFCQENRININTFYWYKIRLKPESQFVELPAVKIGHEKISIQLNSKDISISIPDSFCESTLLRLLKVLAGKDYVC